ncbi:MAG: hypothetical protein KatS3mg124_1058 [Porticoccaceae bacterium]|nr:MAG: hypothetical protein KatS3mg124_1058 [Porticoccaceae bacterium]
MEQVTRNLHGQKMGRKGRATRKRIMDVTLSMLEHRSYKDLTVSEVAAEAGVSSSTFYVYFKDIEDVLFACVQEAALDLDPLWAILKEEWTAENAAHQVRRFVETYNELWDKHRVELRVRNLEADQGNLRFLNIRVETTRDLLQALGKKFAQLNPSLRHPHQLAIVVHAAMSSLAAQHDIGITAATRQSRHKLNDALIELILAVLGNPHSSAPEGAAEGSERQPRQ